MRNERGEAGFTMIEIMVVVAMISVLAAIALPSFLREGRRAKADTEVSPMFAELAIREEQRKMETGAYLAAAACPATPSKTPQAIASCTATGAPWNTLHVNPPVSRLRCSYQIVTGLAGDSVTNPAGFTFSAPPMAWFYILATCDIDGSSAVNSTFFTSSVDTTIQHQNVGQ